jgi:hypothetical protein
MTTRQTVTKATPGADARFVQPEAHAAETYLRQAHWEVYGPGLGAALLGLGFSEEAAWADAATGRMRREASGRR